MFNPSISIYKNLLLIPGFGPSSASSFLAALGISRYSFFSDLPSFKGDLLLLSLSSVRKSSSLSAFNSSPYSFLIEKSLHNFTLENMSRLKSSSSYRGARLAFGFSVRGGRTRSNGISAKKFKFS